jgi:hypothetical protein
MVLVAFASAIWIGIGLVLAGVVAFFTSGSGPTATGTSYDGGRTFHITSYSPGSAPMDVDFGAVIKGWLIYSIVFPIMMLVAYNIWPSATNWFRPLFIGVVLTVGVSLLYKVAAKKWPKFGSITEKAALSVLGFGVCMVVVLLVLIVARLVGEALMR